MVDTRGELEKRGSMLVGKIFSPLPLHPNHWTILSFLVAVLAFIFLIQKEMLLGLIFFALASFIDVIDGAVARFTGRATQLGAFLDGIADRIVEFLILLAILSYSLPKFILPSSIWIFSILFFGTCMTSFVRAYAHHRGLVNEENVGKITGFLDRFKRLVLLIAVVALLYLKMDLYATYLLALIAVLAVITVIQRVWMAVELGK